MNIVNYLTCKQDEPLPPMAALFYEYLLAKNGLFVRAQNEVVAAQIPVSLFGTDQQVRGLAQLETKIGWRLPKPPAALLYQMLADAKKRKNESGTLIEHLYHLRWHIQDERYELHQPEQFSSATFTMSNQTETPANYVTVADFHSHGEMEAYFSEQDNRDETRLRFYGVLGRLDSAVPEVTVRVGVYGHWQTLPYTSFFEPPLERQQPQPPQTTGLDWELASWK